jgi:glycosyltransferase involved in cell wall biosynthesis
MKPISINCCDENEGQPTNSLTSIVLTFNSELSIGQVLAPLKRLSTRIMVVDSFSSDSTVATAIDAGCEVIQHAFENYSQQRNWAQQRASLNATDWVLHVDADEVVGKELEGSIRNALSDPHADGYLVRRLPYFLGQPIRHGHMHPNWHLRLFRAGKGLCEHRLYDQHFILTNGTANRLNGWLHDLQAVSIERWTSTHNRWSGAEAEEIIAQYESANDLSGVESVDDRKMRGSLEGDPRQQRRWLKNQLYYRAPPLWRAFAFFLYSYFIKLGFLDGKVGLVYHVLQAFWFRFLVDAKLVEHLVKTEPHDGQTYL